MKMRILVLIFGLMIYSSTVQAMGWMPKGNHHYKNFHTKVDKHNTQQSKPAMVPELDVNVAGAALALVVGGALVINGRRKKSNA